MQVFICMYVCVHVSTHSTYVCCSDLCSHLLPIFMSRQTFVDCVVKVAGSSPQYCVVGLGAKRAAGLPGFHCSRRTYTHQPGHPNQA